MSILRSKLPSSPFRARQLLAPRKMPTPFGPVETPCIEIPPLKLPSLEANHKKAFGHALGTDLSDLVAFVPWVGGMLADSIRAMHDREMHKLLSPEEYDKYKKWDKTYPDTIALLRTRL